MGERTSEERDIGSQGKQMETPAATDFYGQLGLKQHQDLATLA